MRYFEVIIINFVLNTLSQLIIRILFISLACICITSCGPDYFQWNLDENASTPNVYTLQVASVYTTSAEIDIRLEWDGNLTIQKIGVCYGLGNDPTIDSDMALTDGGEGIRTVLLSNLEPSTTYFARAFAQNQLGVSYGEVVSFTTNAIAAPAVNTLSATNVGVNSAMVGGSISSDGGATITAKGICYSLTSSTPTISGTFVNAGSGGASFTANLTGLQSSTTYYARAFATNSQGTSYGQAITFTTNTAPASLVATNNCSSMSGFTANITFWGGQEYETAPMCITSNGYVGSCISDCATNPLAAYVQFNRTFSGNGYIRFRSKAHENNSIRIPTVLIDGVSVAVTDLTPTNFAYDWHHIKTGNIAEGTHTIRINWSQIVTAYDYAVDEIEFWE